MPIVALPTVASRSVAPHSPVSLAQSTRPASPGTTGTGLAAHLTGTHTEPSSPSKTHSRAFVFVPFVTGAGILPFLAGHLSPRVAKGKELPPVLVRSSSDRRALRNAIIFYLEKYEEIFRELQSDYDKHKLGDEIKKAGGEEWLQKQDVATIRAINGEHKRVVFEYVFSNIFTLDEALQNPTLCADRDKIYIEGHGAAGDACLSGENGETASADEIATMLGPLVDVLQKPEKSIVVSLLSCEGADSVTLESLDPSYPRPANPDGELAMGQYLADSFAKLLGLYVTVEGGHGSAVVGLELPAAVFHKHQVADADHDPDKAPGVLREGIVRARREAKKAFDAKQLVFIQLNLDKYGSIGKAIELLVDAYEQGKTLPPLLAKNEAAKEKLLTALAQYAEIDSPLLATDDPLRQRALQHMQEHIITAAQFEVGSRWYNPNGKSIETTTFGDDGVSVGKLAGGGDAVDTITEFNPSDNKVILFVSIKADNFSALEEGVNFLEEVVAKVGVLPYIVLANSEPKTSLLINLKKYEDQYREDLKSESTLWAQRRRVLKHIRTHIYKSTEFNTFIQKALPDGKVSLQVRGDVLVGKYQANA